MAPDYQIAQVGRYIADAYIRKLLANTVSEDDDLSDESEKDGKGKGK